MTPNGPGTRTPRAAQPPCRTKHGPVQAGDGVAAKILLKYGLSIGHVGSLQDTEHLNKIWKAISCYTGSTVTRKDPVRKLLYEDSFFDTQKTLRKFMDAPYDVADEDMQRRTAHHANLFDLSMYFNPLPES